jgi:DNA-binding NtrC family response regulator
MGSEPQPIHYQLEKKVFEFLYEIELPSDIKRIPRASEVEEYLQFIDRFMEKGDKVGQLNMFAMKEKELRKKYYEGLIELCGGNIAEVARRAGEKDSTVRSRLKSLGVQKPIPKATG